MSHGVLEILNQVGAILTNGHFVYTSGKHGSAYVDKDAVASHPGAIFKACEGIAQHFVHDEVEVVVAPAVGGIAFSLMTAFHLQQLTGRPVRAFYAERRKTVIYQSPVNRFLVHPMHENYMLDMGDKLMIERATFAFGRGFASQIKGKRTLAVEDILNTGGSARAIVEATRFVGGKVVGLGALCNRGGVTAHDVGDVPKLYAEVNIIFEAQEEADCRLCKNGVPINTEVGKGREFLERTRA